MTAVGPPRGGKNTGENEVVQSDDLFDLFEHDAYVAKKRGDRRWAKANEKFEMGIHVAETPEYLLSLKLGSVPGPNNTYPAFKQHYRELRVYLKKKLGLDFEDCLGVEMSPPSHEKIYRDKKVHMTVGNLVHGHGILRFEAVAPDAVWLHDEIAKFWVKRHGDRMIWVKYIDNYEKAMKYCVKDATKGYYDDDMLPRRLLMSKGWYPAGYKDVVVILKKWATWHGAFWKPWDDFSDYSLGEFIPYCWNVMHEYLKIWAHGEGIRLEMDGYFNVITGPQILVFEELE